jgi:8-oxo-dGTP pyrophosphatase MutT (NUDIX family)
MRFHDFIQEPEGWQTLERERHFSNAYLHVEDVTVLTPMRSKPVRWTVCHRKSAVVVAPITADGRLVLVRQERIPIRAALWELPAGQIDDFEEPEAIRATGERELREEAGYQLAPGGVIVPLGFFFTSPGFTDEHAHLVLARPVEPHPEGADHDEAESITACKAFTAAEIRSMIATGEIRDANTLCTFARLTAMDLI